MGIPVAGLLAALLLAAGTAAAAEPAKELGSRLFEERCAACHDNPDGRTPPRSVLQQMRTPEQVVHALARGAMQQQAAGLSADEMGAIALFLTGKAPGPVTAPDLAANRCTSPARPVAPGPGDWNGWGADLDNSRFQPKAGLTAADVPRLKVKWAFGFPEGGIGGQPVVAGGHVFLTGRTGYLFALDAATGCTRWALDLGTAARAPMVLGRPAPGAPVAAFLGDDKGVVHALDAATGRTLWQTRVEDHPIVRLTGGPVLYRGRLYVPVSSLEERAASDPAYPCCSFRGSLVALDAATGRLLWKTHTIAEEPKPFRVNAAGTQMLGPAGAALWSAPTIDAARGLVYVTTGDSYTDIPIAVSNAVMAFDLETGQVRWSRQVLANDNWLVGCEGDKPHANCPSPLGPDFDFGSPPVRRTVPGLGDLLLGSAKSGDVYAFDAADEGRILWQAKVGQGNAKGGILWGPAADDRRLYVAISGNSVRWSETPGGLVALDLATGRELWRTLPPTVMCGEKPCTKAQSAAVSAIPGAVFSGGWDGHIRGYAADNGSILWDFDTAQPFTAVNGVPTRGGAIEGGGQTVAGGTLFVNAGGGLLRPGNALLAFTVDGK